ncbi:MAG: Bax inhibitor-1 family protein [Maricaulaceae bacterium]
MNSYNSRYGAAYAPAGAMDMSVDAGLRAFMLGVYNKMGLGLAWSAVLAIVVGTVQPVTQLVFGTPLLYVVQFGPLALLFGSMFFMRNPSAKGAGLLYWSVVTLIGMGLGVWVLMAASGVVSQTAAGREIAVSFLTIGKAFFITAAAFGALSLWGYTTKKDLSGLGSLLIMGIVGVILISLVNLFVQSSLLEVGLQFVALALFSGIVAWQTQELKTSYYALAGDQRGMAVMTYFGALNLYIAFVNIFQILLSFMGSRE